MKKAVFFALIGAALAAFLLKGLPGHAPIDAQAFVGGLPTLDPAMKLAVARLDLVEVARGDSPKVAWGLDLGTTRAAVSVPARVHFAVDLSGKEPVSFRESGVCVVAVFPDPQVQAVELMTKEKSVLIEPGWGRFAAFSGQSLADQLERGLYDAVRADASSRKLLAQVRAQARPAIEGLVAQFLKAKGDARKVEVRFRSEDEEPGWHLAKN